MIRSAALVVAGILVYAAAGIAQGRGWTQFGGPSRNFTIDAPPLSAWPAAGPKELWRRAIGEGYSPVAVDGGRLYTMMQRGEEEVVLSLDAATGETRWEHAYTAPITNKMSRAPGP